jgi:hypothetical protein
MIHLAVVIGEFITISTYIYSFNTLNILNGTQFAALTVIRGSQFTSLNFIRGTQFTYFEKKDEFVWDLIYLRPSEGWEYHVLRGRHTRMCCLRLTYEQPGADPEGANGAIPPLPRSL